MSRLQTVLAWVIAIAAFTGVQLVASFLGAKIGVPVSLDVDPYTVHYGSGAEEERSSITTAYGWGIHILSILAAVATWYVVQRKQVTLAGRAYFVGFLLGSAVLIIGGIPLWKAFSNSEGLTAILGNLLELALIGAAIFVGVKLTSRLRQTHG